MFGIGVAFDAGIWLEAGVVSCVGLMVAVAEVVREGSGGIVTEAAAGDELVGIRVDPTEGMVDTSLPWHPASTRLQLLTPANGTSHNASITSCYLLTRGYEGRRPQLPAS